MKLTLKADELKKALVPMLRVIPARPSSPSHLFIKFHLSERTGLTLTTTDGNTSVVCRPDCEVADRVDGEALLPASVLSGIIDTLGKTDVTVETKDSLNFILLAWPNGNASLPLTDTCDFPAVPGLCESETMGIHLASKDILEAIRHTRYACSDDPLKENLKNVAIDTHNGECNIVSTNGNVLAVYRTPSRTLSSFPTQFLIHSATADLLKGILDDSDDDVSIEHDSRLLRVTKGTYTVTTSRRSTSFPEWSALAGIMNTMTLKIKREMLEKAVRRIAIFSDRESPTVRINIGQNKEITFHSENRTVNLSASELLYEGEYNGEPLEIGLQPENLLNVLTNTKAEFVVMKISDPRRPVVLTPDTSASTESFTAVMATKM